MADESESEAAPVVATPKEPGDKPLALWERVADAIIAVPVAFLSEIGFLARLFFESILWAVRPPYRFRVLIDAMEFVGVQSIFLVSLTAIFVGAVFSLQLVDSLRQFGAESQVGTIVSLALVRELGPVFAALMISSRAGSAIATELGSMRVSNQIDALTTMSVSPVQYLVAPRLLAGFLMVPAMALLFEAVGLYGAHFVAVDLFGLDGGVFLDNARWYVDGMDVVQSLTKAAVFGVAVTLIACRQGFYASGGAAGVGQATNRAVVQSAVAVLVLDYFVTALFIAS